MPVLVTGATGLIGTNLVRRLISQGEAVRILVRTSSDLGGLEGLPLERRIGDIRDRDTVTQAAQGCSAIFHLAGSVDVTCTSLEKMRCVIVHGTEHVCRAAMDAGVGKVIYTSSCVTAGYGPDGQPATEKRGLPLASLKMPYVAAKVEAEARFLDYCTRGLPGVAVLPGYVFGPWDKHPKLNQLLIMAAAGKLNFYFSGGLSVVAVGDVARGHLLAWKHGRCGERYILSHRNLTYRDFFTLLNRVAGFPAPRWRLPGALLSGFGTAAELAARITHRAPPFTAAMARLYSLRHYVDSTKAKDDLGYTNADLEVSIARTYQWLYEHGDIAMLPPALRHGSTTQDGVGDTQGIGDESERGVDPAARGEE